MKILKDYSNSSIDNWLLTQAEPDYQAFTSKLLPGISPILGVRLPKLRTLAKEITKTDPMNFLSTATNDSFEKIQLQGMVIGYLPADFPTISLLIRNFVPKINNWSVCDSFCSGLKITKKFPQEMWELIHAFLVTEDEFSIRFGIVMMLNYYIDSSHLEEVFQRLSSIKNDSYYVKMGIAWTISICYKKFPDQTVDFMTSSSLSSELIQMSCKKIGELSHVTREKKVEIMQTISISGQPW